MAKRSSSPPLYELIRTRGIERESPPPAAPPPRTPDAHHSPGRGWPSLPAAWLRPGRTLHLPIGYVFVAAALVIVLTAASYMIGHRRGEAQSRYVLAEAAGLTGSEGSQAPIPRDPLEPAVRSPETRQRPLATSDPRVQARPRRDWGPVFSDPRESGLWYLFLMTTNRDGAERFVAFARERGLETYIISANNRLFRVFALPGFESHTTPEAAVFREEILSLGRTWREQTRERVNPVEMSEWSLYGPRR